MPSYDFEVDLQSLAKAAKGMADTVQLMMKDNDVEDFVPSESACGNDEVWAAVEEFKDRWEEGMNNLKSDVEDAAGALGKIAMNYMTFDEDSAKSYEPITTAMSGFDVLRGS